MWDVDLSQESGAGRVERLWQVIRGKQTGSRSGRRIFTHLLYVFIILILHLPKTLVLINSPSF